VKAHLLRFALVCAFVSSGLVDSWYQVSAQTSWECAPPIPQSSPTTSSSPAASPEPSEAADFPEGGGSLTVFAAASLTDAFNEMKTDLEEQNPGLTITYNFAGSQALVTHLSEGAEADVAALASPGQMANAVEADVIDGDASIFARNILTIVVPADNPAGISTPADLGKDGVKLVLAAAEVPAGQYARESFCLMGQDTATYGEGFVDKVAANVVSEEENVRAVLTKVQLGEADAGVVYVTDVTADIANDAATIEIPDNVNATASYPVAAVKDGQTELARAFISYLLGPEGQAILQSHGFLSPE
jgi:molybdate transport system substrate-binding protein